MIKKSGKRSCCGRGGSWFKNCGTAVDANVEHTWVEGFLACNIRAKSKIVLGRQENGEQQLDSDGARMSNLKEDAMAANTFVLTSASTVVSSPVTTPVNMSINMSAAAPDQSRAYGMMNPKGTTATATTIMSTSPNTPTTNIIAKLSMPTSVHTSASATTTMAIGTLAAEQATLVSDWASQGM